MPRLIRSVASILLTALVLPGCDRGPPREFSGDVYFNPSSDESQKKLETLVGRPMPPLDVADWINGEVAPADLKGKVVVVDIWATWCGPCRAAIPHTNDLLARHQSAGLVVVGVCSSEGQDKLADVVASDGIRYPVAKDPGGRTAEAYHVSFFPTYAVIDRAGKVRAIGVTPDGVETVVKKLLAETPPS